MRQVFQHFSSALSFSQHGYHRTVSARRGETKREFYYRVANSRTGETWIAKSKPMLIGEFEEWLSRRNRVAQAINSNESYVRADPPAQGETVQ